MRWAVPIHLIKCAIRRRGGQKIVVKMFRPRARKHMSERERESEPGIDVVNPAIRDAVEKKRALKRIEDVQITWGNIILN